MRRLVLLVSAVAVALMAGVTAPATALGSDPSPTLMATPATGLVDGQAVQIEGDGWSPSSRPRLAECEVGTPKCSFRSARASVDANGHLTVAVNVRALFLAWGGGTAVDCRVVPCEMRIDGTAGDVGAVLAFDPAAPLLPQPTIAVTPATDLVDDDVVMVTAEHFEPGDRIHFMACESGVTSWYDDEARCYSYGNGPRLAGNSDGWGGPEYAGWRRVGPSGTFRERLRVYAEAYADPLIDCRIETCELVAATFGAVLARAPLSFDPEAPLKGPASVVAMSPSTGLLAGDAVRLQGFGFYVREPVIIEQCVVRRRICGPGHARHALAGTEGTFRRAFTVRNHVRANYRPTDCRVVRCVIRISRYGFAPGPRHIDVPIELVS